MLSPPVSTARCGEGWQKQIWPCPRIPWIPMNWVIGSSREHWGDPVSWLKGGDSSIHHLTFSFTLRQVQLEHFPHPSNAENISNCKDQQWVENWYEIFRTTHWHELDLPGKVMWCYHGNREHHRYVKKVARRGVRGRLNWIQACGISVGGCGCMLNIKIFSLNDAWVAVPLFITPLWCSITINIC